MKKFESGGSLCIPESEKHSIGTNQHIESSKDIQNMGKSLNIYSDIAKSQFATDDDLHLIESSRLREIVPQILLEPKNEK